ncbi:FecR family protein [Pseudochryseolinea flava]|nr:FecR family protein [Pseudochryseolinea flava]
MERYLQDKVSPEEKAKLEAWLDAVKTENNKDFDLSKEDQDRLYLTISDKMTSVEDVANFRPSKVRVLTPWIMRIAASLLLILVASVLIWNYYNKNRIQNFTSVDGIQKVMLQDGTIVWLKGGAKLSYTEIKENGAIIRKTSLNGEALFEVAKDASRPFYIDCNGVTVAVIGTSFNLKTIKNEFSLSVLTGKVNIFAEGRTKPIHTLPNETVMIHNGEIHVSQKLDEHARAKFIEGTAYDMNFSAKSLEEVADAFEKKFDVEISFTDESVKSCKITADFTDQSLDTSLKMITEVFNVTYTEKENAIAFSGSGCN